MWHVHGLGNPLGYLRVITSSSAEPSAHDHLDERSDVLAGVCAGVNALML